MSTCTGKPAGPEGKPHKQGQATRPHKPQEPDRRKLTQGETSARFHSGCIEGREAWVCVKELGCRPLSPRSLLPNLSFCAWLATEALSARGAEGCFLICCVAAPLCPGQPAVNRCVQTGDSASAGRCLHPPESCSGCRPRTASQCCPADRRGSVASLHSAHKARAQAVRRTFRGKQRMQCAASGGRWHSKVRYGGPRWSSTSQPAPRLLTRQKLRLSTQTCSVGVHGSQRDWFCGAIGRGRVTQRYRRRGAACPDCDPGGACPPRAPWGEHAPSGAAPSTHIIVDMAAVSMLPGEGAGAGC
jgi:hypothetical protein